MTDFLWREGTRTLARYVDSDEIEVNTVARLNSDEVCGYEEGGSYVGNYTELSPNLKPKPGIISKLFGRKAPERNHLFVSKGPHKLIMKIESKWSSREEANVLAIITVSFPSDHIGRLFTLARGAEGGIVSASTLISAVQLDVNGKFNEYVLNLNNPDDFETKADIIRIEDEFAEIAETEFTKIGVIVQSVTLNFGDSENEKLLDLQAKSERLMKTGIERRRLVLEKSFDATAGGLSSLADTIEAKASMEAHGELSDRSASVVARESVKSQERELLSRIKEAEDESISSRKIRETERKTTEQQALINAAKALQSLVVDSTEDGGADAAEE